MNVVRNKLKFPKVLNSRSLRLNQANIDKSDVKLGVQETCKYFHNRYSTSKLVKRHMRVRTLEQQVLPLRLATTVHEHVY